MEAQQQLTLKEIVIRQPHTAALLEKYGLDFCCKGNRTLQEACNAKGLSIPKIEQEIDELIRSLDARHTTLDFNRMEPDELIRHILHVHHQYVRESLPVIHAHTQKVARVHGTRHPETAEIAGYFEKVKCEMEQHMMKEEHILFPYIYQMVEAKRNYIHLPASHFGSVQHPIGMMEMEHEAVGDAMEQIKKLSSTYVAPADACTTYKISYMELDRFEKDLHQHVHLENNILFPKAILLEKELLQQG